MEGKKVCIVSAGNAAHALSAMWPHMGFETYLWSGYQDEAERMNKGLEQGPITATFAPGNPFEGIISGKPVKVAKDPGQVIPQCDVIFAPLPSFAYESVFAELKPHLREGQYICLSPGAGGADWIAHKVLGDELFNKIVLFTVSPMPFNCRIEEWSRSVKVQVLKQVYDICAQPVRRLGDCVKIVSALFPKSVCSGLGPVLAATLMPLNPVIHPARVFTLLTVHYKWKPGVVLPENPFFYEEMTELDTANQLKVNADLDAIVAAANAQGINLQVPDCYNFLAKTYNGVQGDYPPVKKPTPADLCRLWHGPMYKTFRCPLKDESGGWVPDFKNRYFTEDIPCGLCTYKGVAQVFGQKTPFIDEIITWAQGHMGKDYIKDGTLNEALIGEMYVPQRFGIHTPADFKRVMGIGREESIDLSHLDASPKGAVEMKVSLKKSKGFYVKAALNFLNGMEAKPATEDKLALEAKAQVEAIRISGIGEACNVAMTTAAVVEEKGAGTIVRVQTNYPSMSGRPCPQVLIDLKKEVKRDLLTRQAVFTKAERQVSLLP